MGNIIRMQRAILRPLMGIQNCILDPLTVNRWSKAKQKLHAGNPLGHLICGIQHDRQQLSELLFPASGQ